MGGNSAPTSLVDHYCYRPADELGVELMGVMKIWRKSETFEKESIDFQEKIATRSGLKLSGTFLPKAIHPKFCEGRAKTGENESMVEAKECLFGAVEGLLEKTGISAQDVDILICCCSIFCPTPSLTAAIVNHFKMKPSIQSYHLGGMGCSMGVVSVNLIRDLLKAHPNSNAVLVTTETTTPAFYQGNERSRLVTNMLFRMGGAAILFSNKPKMARRAKYELREAVRIHQGSIDAAYGCITYSPDDKGINGISLGKDVVTEAGRGLETIIRRIAPRVLDFKEIFQYTMTEAKRKLGVDIPRYKPSFDRCLDHVLIHAGGAKVLEGLGQNLKLSEYMLKPSYDVLYHYGNVSSSTTWYTMSNVESMRGVKKGDTVMQIGVGSGVKCGVNIWKAKRDIHEVHDAWKHVHAEIGGETRRPCLSKGLFSTSTMSLMFFFVCLMVAIFMGDGQGGVDLKSQVMKMMPEGPFISS
ncbi:hypothetical protein BSKO_06108 [Bryopsis sp. KO-2023]|nr:hypothetical protein BSKO_06108 [Bryopsis sp. KO-2023]